MTASTAIMKESSNTFHGAIGTISVPTKDRQQEYLEVDGLDEQGIETLLKSDPFMYSSIPDSIPGNRSSTASDDSSQVALSGQDRQAFLVSRRHSAPAEINRPIRRHTSISFEFHPSVLVEDMMWNDPDLPLLGEDLLSAITSELEGLDYLLGDGEEDEDLA